MRLPRLISFFCRPPSTRVHPQTLHNVYGFVHMPWSTVSMCQLMIAYGTLCITIQVMTLQIANSDQSVASSMSKMIEGATCCESVIPITVSNSATSSFSCGGNSQNRTAKMYDWDVMVLADCADALNLAVQMEVTVNVVVDPASTSSSQKEEVKC